MQSSIRPRALRELASLNSSKPDQRDRGDLAGRGRLGKETISLAS